MENRDPRVGPPTWFLVVALTIPLAGLALLLGVPSLDVHWEHHPSHFWLVFGVAIVNVALGLVVSEVARRSDDERLFLVSMVLLTSAGFLALHALATPGVVLSGPNGGFVLATPIGLLLASGFAALSSIEMDARTEASLRRWQAPMRIGLVVVLVAWAAASIARVGAAGPGDRVGTRAVAPDHGAVRCRSPTRSRPGATWRSIGGVGAHCHWRSRSPSSSSPKRWSRSRSAERGKRRGGSGTC